MTISAWDPQGNEVRIGGATEEARQARLAELRATWDAETNRSALIAKAHALVAAVRTQSQQEIDTYGATGTGWPVPPEGQAPTAAMLVQRIEILRVAALTNDAQKVRLCVLFDVLVKVLERLIASDTTLQPPTDL
jgi:hypothetical protein